MTSAIREAVDFVDPSRGRVCDLFSGTGVVGAALAANRDVLCADIQEYARVLASAMLHPPGLSSAAIEQFMCNALQKRDSLRTAFRALIDYESRCLGEFEKGDPTMLVELQESAPVATFRHSDQDNSAFATAHRKVAHLLAEAGLYNDTSTTVTRHFGGVYFSFEQAVAMDAILFEARRAGVNARDTLIAAALSVASDLVNSIGKQFAQPIRPMTKQGTVKVPLIRAIAKDRATDALSIYARWLSAYSALPKFLTETSAVCGNYLDILKTHGRGCSVVYADPPYTRDHYSRFYHVLETMALGDEPLISTMKKAGEILSSRGVYRQDRHQSPFCIRSLAPQAFEDLFREVRRNDAALVLSYSPSEKGDGTHPRVVSMSQIIDAARSFYTKVTLFAVEGLQHNQLNRLELKLRSRLHSEVLICCSM